MTSQIPFRTTEKQRRGLYYIFREMLVAGVDVRLAIEATDLAHEDQGVFDLLKLWLNNPQERSEIIQDVKDVIEWHKKEPNDR